MAIGFDVDNELDGSFGMFSDISPESRGQYLSCDDRPMVIIEPIVVYIRVNYSYILYVVL